MYKKQYKKIKMNKTKPFCIVSKIIWTESEQSFVHK